jgi:arsenate reductase
MKRVLFICTGNRARSQMGEGLLRHLGGERYEVHSAGTLPSGLADETVDVMKEVGIDVSGQWSKHVDEFAGEAFDYVITVCDSARQECPVFPNATEMLHWDVEDPSDTFARGGTLLDAFRSAREELRRRIAEFLTEAGQA